MRDGATRYQEALATIPPPGCGNGCHSRLLGVANIGVKAGFSADQLVRDLREAIPRGRRPIYDREIRDAVNRAVLDHTGGFPADVLRKVKPIVNNGPATLREFIQQGRSATEDHIRAASPVPIPERPENHTILLLETLYHPGDFLFIGDRYQNGIVNKNIRNTDDWCRSLLSVGKTGPFIIVNPLTGRAAQKKNGDGITYRGDACIAQYKHALVEFDNLSRHDQIRFWSTAKLPVLALVDSGGKSIHAWIDVQQLANVRTVED